MDYSTPGFPVLHHLLDFAQSHVYWVDDAIQPSHPLSPPSPPALNLSQHQDLFQPVSQLFSSGGQRIEVSALASVLPKNIQGWFPLGLTGLISLLSKGLSRVFSSATIRKHQFFSTQPSLWRNTKVKLLSCVRLFASPWTVAHQAPPSIGFSRQEYWRGLPFPSPGDLPNPGIEPGSPALEADAFNLWATREARRNTKEFFS